MITVSILLNFHTALAEEINTEYDTVPAEEINTEYEASSEGEMKSTEDVALCGEYESPDPAEILWTASDNSGKSDCFFSTYYTTSKRTMEKDGFGEKYTLLYVYYNDDLDYDIGSHSLMGHGVDVELSGTVSSPDIYISSVAALGLNVGLGASDNRIKISISEGMLKKPYTEIWVSDKIDDECIEFDLHGDLILERYSSRSYCTIGSEKYKKKYAVKYGMISSNPCGYTTKTVGDYEITYPSKLPWFGNYKLLDIRDITVINKRTGEEVSANWIQKIVKLKKAPGNQGPFPEHPNAAMQLFVSNLKDYGDPYYGDLKSDLKKLKQLTKVYKNKTADEQALPVIIYPVRLDSYCIFHNGGWDYGQLLGAALKGKKDKYKLSLELEPYIIYGEKSFKITIKDGSKDRFKTGRRHLSYDSEKKIVSVNSAEVWSGPNGVPIRSKTVSGEGIPLKIK